MGGKSRKGGRVSKALIDRLKAAKKAKLGPTISAKPVEEKSDKSFGF